MTYKDRKTIDVYRGHVGDFTLNYVTGDVEAQGPGEIIAWKRKLKDGGFAARETSQANRPIPTEISTWDYTQVQFEGRLKGRFDGQGTKQSTRQRAMIEDRVEVVYGPVKDSTEKLIPIICRRWRETCDAINSSSSIIRNPNAIPLNIVNWSVTEMQKSKGKSMVDDSRLRLTKSASTNRKICTSFEGMANGAQESLELGRAIGPGSEPNSVPN